MKTALASIAISITLLSLAVGAAAAEDTIKVSAVVNGRDAGESAEAAPVIINPGESTKVELSVQNSGEPPITVTAVTLTGDLFGLELFRVTSPASLQVGTSERSVTDVEIGTAGLDGNVTGLITGEVIVLYDQSGDSQVATVPIVASVRGSKTSVYALIGLTLLIATFIAMIDTIAVALRKRLPAYPIRRGLFTMVPGIAAGLLIVFALAAAAIWVPTLSRTLVVTGICTGVCFLVGFISAPHPLFPPAEPDPDTTYAR